MRGELSRAQEALAEARAAAERTWASPAWTCDELETELEGIAADLDGPLRRKGEELKTALAAAAEAAKLAHDEHEALKARAEEQTSGERPARGGGDLGGRGPPRKPRRSTREKRLEGKRAESAATIAENDTSVAQLREVNDACARMPRKCAREKAAMSTSTPRWKATRRAAVAELQKLYDQATRRMAKEEQRLGRPQDRVQRELNAQTSLQAKIRHAEQTIKRAVKKLQPGEGSASGC